MTFRTLREISGTDTPRIKIYFVPTYACAQAHGLARKYVRNKHIRLQAQAGTDERCLLGTLRVVAYRHYGSHDSRYDGPRSSYGRALRRMEDEAGDLHTISAPASAIPYREHPGATKGDLYLTRQPGGFYARYDWHGKLRGLAMRRTAESSVRPFWPVELDRNGQYWERGSSVAEICNEEERKCNLARAKKADRLAQIAVATHQPLALRAAIHATRQAVS